MSLLLDALKKSGDNQQKGTGLSDLTLEDAPPARATAAPASPAPASASRAAGETLFAAKKKKAPTTMRWKLGLVPTTFLICSVLGSGYGYYVWLELQPPSQPRVAQRTAPPPPPPVAQPIAVAAAPAVPLVPLMPTPVEEKIAPSTEHQSALPDEDFDTPRSKAKAVKPRKEDADGYPMPAASPPRSKSAGAGVTIRRQVEADTVTPALLDAYQAYQRGDYVTAAQGYRQVLGKDTLNRDALLGMAATSQQQGQDEAAQHYYRQLLVLDPRDPIAQAALLAYAPDDSGNSESRLKQLLAEQPRSGALHFALGNVYAEQSNWSEAQQAYFNAQTLEPNNAQFVFNLAVSLDHLGQGKLASQYYQQALQLDASGKSGFDRTQAEQRLNELTSSR